MPPKKRLELVSRHKHLNQLLWFFEKEYAYTLAFVMENWDISNDFYLRQYCRDFIDNLVILNLRKPSDILACISKIEKKELIIQLIKEIVNHNFTDNYWLIGFYRSHVILELPFSSECFDILCQKHTEFLLYEDSKQLNISDLFPLKIDYSKYIKEYILSWVFEEYRLSKEGEYYFSTNFNKKYIHLKSIRKDR